MVQSKAAERYARSLFQLATEKGLSDRVLQDVSLYRSTLGQDDALRSVMNSPIIPGSKKQGIVDALFVPRFDALTNAFFRLVIAKGREKELVLIADAYIREDKRAKGIREGQLTTATALSSDLREKLQAKAEKMAGGKVILTEKIDPALIGGFVLKVGDIQYDASSKTQLEKLREQLLDHSYVPKIDLI